jgi:menaquinone-dependent protoporphyrinogen oxidase
MSDVLIVYASTHGHTAKIAERIAHAVRAGGATPRTFDIGAGCNPIPSAYDLVIAGGSVHAGHHQGELREWAAREAVTLNRMPAAFFSVCLTAADDTDEAHAATRGYIDDFLEDTGWAPRLTATFAGALQYLEYNFATRLVMRLMMARGQHPTNVHEDVDYTDWDAVDAFARDCVLLASQMAVPTTAPMP